MSKKTGRASNIMNLNVFGPVPSRRLGRSLGINNIPPKACPYSCLYCQVGKTTRRQVVRQTFYDPQKLVDETKAKIAQLDNSQEKIDYLTKIVTCGRYKAETIDHLKWSTKLALRKAKKIITVSNYSKNEIVEIYKSDPKKIKVIHNGYSVNWYRKIKGQEKINEVLDKYGIEKPYILYVGRLEKKKNTSISF